MANGWALGKFGGEFGQSTQTYGAIYLVISEVGQLQSSLSLRAYFAYRASHVSVCGTFETCRPVPPMSVGRGRPEVIGASSNRRD
jgi:hypothetical protein